MRKRKKKRLKATSLWVQQVGQNMSNGILQPLVFHHLFISAPISLTAVPIRSIRPRRIKFTDKIIRTESQIRSRKWGSRPDVTATPARPIAGVCTKSTHTTKPTSNFTEPGPNLKGRSLILVYLQRNMPMSSKAHTSRTRKTAIARVCRAQAVLAMDDVEGGTRLSGDALRRRVDASKNRIPKWKLYQGAVLSGRTGGMRLPSQAKKRDEGQWYQHPVIVPHPQWGLYQST